MDLAEAIREAGNKFDGHVTNGSHAEIMKVVNAALESLEADLKREREARRIVDEALRQAVEK